MGVIERKREFAPREGQGKRPKLGLKFGQGDLSARPYPRVEGAR